MDKVNKVGVSGQRYDPLLPRVSGCRLIAMLLKPQVLCRMMVVVLKMMRVGFEAKGVGRREGKSSAAY